MVHPSWFARLTVVSPPFPILVLVLNIVWHRVVVKPFPSVLDTFVLLVMTSSVPILDFPCYRCVGSLSYLLLGVSFQFSTTLTYSNILSSVAQRKRETTSLLLTRVNSS